MNATLHCYRCSTSYLLVCAVSGEKGVTQLKAQTEGNQRSLILINGWTRSLWRSSEHSHSLPHPVPVVQRTALRLALVPVTRSRKPRNSLELVPPSTFLFAVEVVSRARQTIALTPALASRPWTSKREQTSLGKTKDVGAAWTTVEMDTAADCALDRKRSARLTTASSTTTR